MFKRQNGFSLIELMVTVGILVMINIMIFASYPEFSQKISLKRTTEEVALIVRQAQAYALGIKRTVSSGDNYFGFGVHFETNNSKSLILFTDSGLTPNKIYDAGDYSINGCGGANTECFQEFKIDTGDYISDLQTCRPNDACSSINSLDIVYPRASSMAEINNDGNLSYALMTIKSSRGKEKKIEIWASGQISVKD